MSYVLDLQGLEAAAAPQVNSTISIIICLSDWSIVVCFQPNEG